MGSPGAWQAPRSGLCLRVRRTQTSQGLLFGGLSVGCVCMGVCGAGVCLFPESSLFEERMVLGERSPPAPCPGQRRLLGGQPPPCSPGLSPDLELPPSSSPAPGPHPLSWTAALSPGFSAGSAPPACLEGRDRVGGGLCEQAGPGVQAAAGAQECVGWEPRLGSSPGPSATGQGSSYGGATGG